MTMASSQLSPRFVIFVVVSLVTHLLELAACGLFCHMLFQQGYLKAPWFSLSAGLVIIPMVAVQLVSAVFLLRRKGEGSTTYEVTATAVLHVLQLGFISRHFAVLQEAPIASKRAEVVEMLLLRLSFAVTSGCTIFLTQIYLLFRDVFEASWIWAAYVSEISLLVSITWALSTFRRSLPEVDFDLVVISWPGTALKHLWRGGELLARAIALGLFASIYTHWLFLVLGLHWAAMLVCLCIPLMASVDWAGVGCARRTLNGAMTSFVYIFAFINTSPENAVFRYTFFYVIIFLENATLIAVWLIQSSSDELSDNVAFVYVAAFAYVTAIASMIVYYKFFHVASIKSSPERSCGNENCDACKIVVGSHHPPIPPRPGAVGNWLSQYQASAYCGNDLKHDKQDSLLDCERSSNATISSLQARLQQKLASVDADHTDFSSGNSRHACDAQDGTSSFTGNDAAVASSGSKPGKKGDKKQKRCLNNSESEISSIRTDPDRSEDGGSQKRPVWLPSGDSNFTNQLLTCSLETFNAADDERSSVATASYHGHRKQPPPGATADHKDAVYTSMSLPRYVDYHWYSDGYSTDRTNDGPNYPVAPLQRTAWLGEPGDEGECCNCLERSHGDSEVSSIMRSITTVPESDDEEGAENGDNPDFHHLPQRPCHHKKSSAAHQHHQPNAEDVVLRIEPSTHDDRWLGPSRVGKHSREILSSPASDPSYGPSTKRKRSPKRKAHASIERSQSSSKHLSANQSATSINSKLPHVNLNSNTGKAGPSRGDQHANAGGLNGADHFKNSLSEIQQPANADPRLTARVMAGEDRRCADISHRNSVGPEKRSDERELSAGEAINDSGVSRDPSGEFSVNPEHDICETNCNSTALKNVKDKRTLQVIRNVDGNDGGLKSRADKQMDTGVVSLKNFNNAGDVIYENIWQVGKLHSSKSRHVVESDVGVPMATQTKPFLYRSTPAPDGWYVCSESEDSALPPEILNSSIDCFTPSETESDLSLEIVI